MLNSQLLKIRIRITTKLVYFFKLKVIKFYSKNYNNYIYICVCNFFCGIVVV